MNGPEHRDASPAESAPDFNALIASLRAAGADRFDPVRLRYMEALARRATAQRGNVKGLLDARLAQALAAFKERFERAQGDAGEIVARGVQQYPYAAGDLQRLLAAGDFKGLRRSLAALKAAEQRSALSALVRLLEPQAPQPAEVRAEENAAPRPELKTVRNFRKTWSKLSVDKQVSQALVQAPKNAGPINSHMLVLRSLALMRDISPDYLNRFVSHAETLLCLDQAEKDKPAHPKKGPAGKAAKR